MPISTILETNRLLVGQVDAEEAGKKLSFFIERSKNTFACTASGQGGPGKILRMTASVPMLFLEEAAKINF